MLVLQNSDLWMPHNKHNMFRMGLPSGHICIAGEAINTPGQLLGLSVSLSVCLPAGLSAGLQQHDVSRPQSTH